MGPSIARELIHLLGTIDEKLREGIFQTGEQLTHIMSAKVQQKLWASSKTTIIIHDITKF
jgi:hypothetical protein